MLVPLLCPMLHGRKLHMSASFHLSQKNHHNAPFLELLPILAETHQVLSCCLKQGCSHLAATSIVSIMLLLGLHV